MRAASRTGSSSSRTSTAACAMIGPVSVPSSTKCTVQPESFTPASSARRGAWSPGKAGRSERSEEHTSELQSRENLVCRLLLEKKKKGKAIDGREREKRVDQRDEV